MGNQSQIMQERWALVDGVPVFYRAGTERAPVGALPLILIHGFAISGRYLLPTAERLAPFHPTYVPDLPGFGRSPRLGHTLSIPELARSVAGFMDAIGLDRAVLVGNSLGGAVIIEFADQFPDRITHAVLVSPAGGPQNRPLPKGLAQLAVDAPREPLRLIPIALVDYVRFGFLPALKLFRAMVDYPVAERARLVTVPTLIVVGERDPLVSERRILDAFADLQQVTAVRIRGAAHAINFSHPDELAQVVRRFLTGQPIDDDPYLKERTVVIASPG